MTTQRASASTGDGDDRQAVEERLVREHLPLVRHAVAEVVGRVPRHVSRDDLESAAMLGLAQAARTFDPGRGIAFERHAGNRVRGALLDELRGSDWASRSVRARARRMQRATEELAVRLGRIPSVAEVAAELGMAPESLHKLLGDVHRATILNYDSIVAEGDAEVLLPADTETPDQVLLDRERLPSSTPGSWRPSPARPAAWRAARRRTTPPSPPARTTAPASTRRPYRCNGGRPGGTPGAGPRHEAGHSRAGRTRSGRSARIGYRRPFIRGQTF